MKKEIDNTSKPVLRSDDQAIVDKTSTTTTQDNASLMGRRRLLKGLGAAPLVMTLHNGAAMAASSTGGCVGTQTIDDIENNGCRSGIGADHDSFLRVEVGKEPGLMLGRAEGYDWGVNGKHPYYKESDKEKNLCLVSVDAETGEIHTDRVDSSMLTTNSCWTSFT